MATKAIHKLYHNLLEYCYLYYHLLVLHLRNLTSADVIHIATEVYNSDRQLAIMQNLSATTIAVTAV